MKAFSDIQHQAVCAAAVLMLCGVAFFLSCTSVTSSGDEELKAVAYVFGRNDAPLPSVDGTRLTHVNYAFAFIEDGEVVLRSASDSENLATLTSLRATNPDLKILLSVGGWGGSEGFSDAALTDSTRNRFARSLIDLIEAYDLDGADIDWEYPGQIGAGNTFRPEDRTNFTRFLGAIRSHFDAAETSSRHYLLTIAAATNDDYFDHTEMGSAQEYLDFVNLMTYDFSGPWTNKVWHHTNLHASSMAGSSPSGVDVAVDRCVAAGVPAQKVVVGAAFYGRGWVDVDGLNTAASDSTLSIPYHDIPRLLAARPDIVRVWDEQAEAPYLRSDSSRLFITYDDAESISRKIRFVRSRGLGGIMFWEYGADTTGTLLNAIHMNLREDS